jgi:uroporphyrinogen-III synthase
MAALERLAILLPESRELDLFASMLEAEGARVRRCPLVQICDLEETAAAQAWIEAAIAGRFADVIWLTGEGLRRLLPLARRMGKEGEFVAALARMRHITRGPKPARALRELGLAPGLAAATPTSQGVLESLGAQDLAGREIGVQLYPGDRATSLLAALQARGATTWPVTPYRYASQTEDASVAEAIRALATDAFGLVIFTATPQVDRLFEVARRNGLEEDMRAAFTRVPVAVIGPVVEEALRLRGIAPALRPRSSFHLKPLLRAIGAWRAA